MRLFGLAMAAWTVLAGGLTAAPPNVVFILADDLGARDLGCYGSTYHRTPNLDRLAKEGALFTQAYAAASICSPTRASIITGQHPARLKITDWLPGRADRPDQRMLRPTIANELPASATLLPELFKKQGYATGIIGKWHLGSKSPLEQGFTTSIAADFMGSPRSYFAPYAGGKGAIIPGLEKAPEGEYLTDRLTTEAENFLTTNRDRPFFLYLSHYAVHLPMVAKPEIQAKYKPGSPTGQGNPIYAAMLESLDESVGRVMKKLEDLNIADNTLIIFTSDNGGLCVLEGKNTPATSNAPLREGKGYLYEGGIRVPLLVKWPGVAKAGSKIDIPVSSVDFFPTLTEAIGKPEKGVDGLSWRPALEGKSLDRKALYWHYPHYSNQGGRPSSAIREGNYKLVEFLEGGRQELFDVVKDPGENQNLIKSQAAIAKQLSEQLNAWRKEVGAAEMKPNPNYRPNPPNKEGIITMPSSSAQVYGIQLRYEPLPHKTTLGYWVNAEDYAIYDFTVTQAGEFTIEMLQGCGKGQGGSEVEVDVAGQKNRFIVEDTGHFQNFKARDIGKVKLEPGQYQLKVKPIKKAAAAIMDIRQIRLKPTAK
jgi:arylsulfatase A